MNVSPFDPSLEFALQQDQRDPLRHFRDEFHIPRRPDGEPQVYLVGNSLGLQPKRTATFVQTELDKWRDLAAEAHFAGSHPWMPYHEFLSAPMAEIVGGLPHEVVVMNSLTVNLHLMLATFYQPTRTRHKILIEKGAFPSDHFAVESHLRMRGFDPAESMLLVAADKGDECVSLPQVREIIERHSDSLAVIMLPGVQYYTGQFWDIPSIVKLARQHNIAVGFDLAHAVGNVPLALHDWNVDFAVWCNYKYMNSGPGALGGCFIHERHAEDTHLPRLAGWWGQNKSTRFEMKNDFHPIPTVEGWQLSNPTIFSMAAIRASLEVFAEAGGLPPLREKSLRLTGYLASMLRHEVSDAIRPITPEDPDRRGCQLSLVVSGMSVGKQLTARLVDAGVMTDWREPNVIRVAPAPLYNSFEDVFNFVQVLKRVVSS